MAGLPRLPVAQEGGLMRACSVGLLFAVFFSACATGRPSDEGGWRAIGESPEFLVVGEELPPDSALSELLRGYREKMGDQLAEVLSHAAGDFVKSDPEGALDNLVADAALEVMRARAPGGADVVLLNDGGLRVPISKGPILMRHAYELLPFENRMVILEFSGEQLLRLADQIARSGGEPIAGWTMEIGDSTAREVQVDGRPVDPGAVYRLVTVDYLADGGGVWPVLWEDVPRQDFPPLIREVFVEYLRGTKEVHPTLDKRIRRVADRPDDAEKGLRQ